MSRTTFAALILTTSFLSCKKYGNGYISGTVLEKGSNQPLPNVTVKISYKNDKKGTGGVLDSVETDSEGKFTYHFKKRMNTMYTLDVREENHWSATSHLSQSDNKKTQLTIYMDPFAYLKLRIIKNTSAPTFIEMHGPSYFSSYTRTTSDPFDTVIGKFKIHGNEKTEISWSTSYALYMNIDPTYYNQEVVVNKGDSLFYTIQFD